MNILFVANDPAVFTVGSSTHRRMSTYAEALALTYGGELHILSRGHKTYSKSYGSLVLHSVAAGRIGAISSLPIAARRIIEEKHIAIVSAQDPFEHGQIALKAVRGTKAKLHIQIHTDFLSPWFVRTGIAGGLLNRWRIRIADEVLPKADGIRVVSKRIQESVAKKYRNLKEASIIPIAVAGGFDSSNERLPGKYSFTLVAVGRLEKEKRVQDLIEAMYRSPWKAGLVIIGDGRERGALEDLAHQEGQAERVIFTGNRSDARSLMAQADAFVQVSAYEGYGLTLIEAALAGVPIITTDVGIIGDVLDSQTDVYTVPIADPPAIAARVTELMKDGEEGRLRAERAKAHVEEHLARTDSSPRAIIEDMARLV